MSAASLALTMSSRAEIAQLLNHLTEPGVDLAGSTLARPRPMARVAMVRRMGQLQRRERAHPHVHFRPKRKTFVQSEYYRV